MWNFIKSITDFIDRLADLLGINNSYGDVSERIRKEANLVPVRVRVLHDGKHPNTSR
jgi:hypothetical protein